MTINPAVNIPMSYKPGSSPMENLQGALTLADMMDQRRLRRQQLLNEQQTYGTQQGGLQRQGIVRQVLSQSGAYDEQGHITPDTLMKIKQIDPSAGQSMEESQAKSIEQQSLAGEHTARQGYYDAEGTKMALDVANAQAKTHQAESAMVVSSANKILKLPTEQRQGAWDNFIKAHVAGGSFTQLKQSDLPTQWKDSIPTSLSIDLGAEQDKHAEALDKAAQIHKIIDDNTDENGHITDTELVKNKIAAIDIDEADKFAKIYPPAKPLKGKSGAGSSGDPDLDILSGTTKTKPVWMQRGTEQGKAAARYNAGQAMLDLSASGKLTSDAVQQAVSRTGIDPTKIGSFYGGVAKTVSKVLSDPQAEISGKELQDFVRVVKTGMKSDAGVLQPLIKNYIAGHKNMSPDAQKAWNDEYNKYNVNSDNTMQSGNIPKFNSPNDQGFKNLPTGSAFIDSEGHNRIKH